MNWKDIVKGVAPVLGGALGGPFGGVAAKVLADKLLGNPNADVKDIEQFILGASPEQLAVLKRLDQQFEKDMAELGFKKEELHVRDRESAREMAKVDMKPQIILSVIYTLGYCLVLYAFMGGDVEILDNTKAEFNMVLGVMTAAQVQILNFWFGSSSGSKEKDAIKA